MSYKFSPLVLISLFGIWFSSCDDALTPKDFDEQAPFVKNLNVTPSELSFVALGSSPKDTTLNFDLHIEGMGFNPDSMPYLSFFLNDSEVPLIQKKLTRIGQTQFTSSFDYSTKTYFYETYTILVTPSLSEANANYSQYRETQIGVPFTRPEILEATNPQQIQRPTSGNINVDFLAKATDLDRQKNLQGVFLRLISRTTGEVNNSPFELFDNGISAGDRTAADSVYTLTFPINSGNQLQTYDILYYAKDKSGLVSDTVKTTFSIVE